MSVLPVHRMLYAVSITTGAFLLFLVQPLIAHQLLPRFGGAASVWIVSLLFFQAFLLAGYYYAHVLSKSFAPKRQLLIHCVLVAIAIPLAFLQLDIDQTLPPAADLLLLLSLRIGPAFILLAATSPLIQHWFSAHSDNPYRLYALSNAGSLGALLVYPFLIEPFTDISDQYHAWLLGLILYLASCLGLHRVLPEVGKPSTPSGSVVLKSKLLWLSLAATGSIVLLSVTNVITRQIAPMPLLWVLPLSIYLVTFIISFEHPRWYRPAVMRGIWVLSAAGLVALYLDPYSYPTEFKLTIYSMLVFSSCLICHGELYRRRPGIDSLTEFYLLIAAGGVIGAILVSLVSPAIFNNYYFVEIGLLLVVGLSAITWFEQYNKQRKIASGVLLAGVPLLAAFFIYHYLAANTNQVFATRSFYARYQVLHEGQNSEQERFEFHSDNIIHGSQLHKLPKFPGTYFSIPSGVGVALNNFPGAGRKVGIVGLGIGTIAAYGEPADHFRFYEIDPAVIDIAWKYFRYLENSHAKIDIIEGDARLSLEKEVAETQGSYDILIIDAFSGDAVPTHLLTRQAWDLYWRLLKPDGILVVQVTNIFLELTPVVAGHMDPSSGRKLLNVQNQAEPTYEVYAADWLIVTNSRDFLQQPEVRQLAREVEPMDKPPLWTDERSSVLPILRTR